MKHKIILKILVILLLLCGIADCIFQRVTISVASEEKKITYVDTVNNTTYTVLKKEIPKIEQFDQDILNKENSNNNETTRSQKINEQDIIVNNSITIPNVCTNALLSIGSTQEAVDTNDICIMTEANNSNFGDNKVRPIKLYTVMNALVMEKDYTILIAEQICLILVTSKNQSISIHVIKIITG